MYSSLTKVEEFQKQAIYMQMTEYKRKFEQSCADLDKFKQRTSMDIEKLSAFRHKVFMSHQILSILDIRDDSQALENINKGLFKTYDFQQDYDKVDEF
jgi:molecular chaperone GrpE (heat shock protein)